MRVIEAHSFRKVVRRLHDNQKQALDDAIRVLMRVPATGEGKKGDLTGLRVYKFHMVNQQMLLAYRYDAQADALLLEMLGSHENFYRDLKKQ